MTAYTQADLDNIRALRGTGVSRVEIKGKVTTFRNESDLRALEQRIASCLEKDAEGDQYVPSRRAAFTIIPCRD